MSTNGNGGAAALKVLGPETCKLHEARLDNLTYDVRKLQVAVERIEGKLDDLAETAERIRLTLSRRMEQLEEVGSATLALLRQAIDDGRLR